MKTHGLSKTRLYRVFKSMKDRCFNKNNAYYKNYGGRGITICREWLDDFAAFYNWALCNGYDENAPKGECTIDRINNNGNYEPSNCRWVNNKVQQSNKRSNKKYKYKNKLMTQNEIAKDLNISPATLINRINKYGFDKAISYKYNEKPNTKYITYKNKTMNLKDWAIVLEIPYTRLSKRISEGWEIEKAFCPISLLNKDFYKLKLQN